MEDTTVRGDLNSTPDLHATIRRLSQQVSDLHQNFHQLLSIDAKHQNNHLQNETVSTVL